MSAKPLIFSINHQLEKKDNSQDQPDMFPTLWNSQNGLKNVELDLEKKYYYLAQ